MSEIVGVGGEDHVELPLGNKFVHALSQQFTPRVRLFHRRVVLIFLSITANERPPPYSAITADGSAISITPRTTTH
ncbi:hypothetical protein [Microbulbifer sp.]|uniref:hypothetical protein n=1 Tax=Microbulbifer sp. TaxID=1908541 RepID=UPI003F2A6237